MIKQIIARFITAFLGGVNCTNPDLRGDLGGAAPPWMRSPKHRMTPNHPRANHKATNKTPRCMNAVALVVVFIVVIVDPCWRCCWCCLLSLPACAPLQTPGSQFQSVEWWLTKRSTTTTDHNGKKEKEEKENKNKNTTILDAKSFLVSPAFMQGHVMIGGFVFSNGCFLHAVGVWCRSLA